MGMGIPPLSFIPAPSPGMDLWGWSCSRHPRALRSCPGEGEEAAPARVGIVLVTPQMSFALNWRVWRSRMRIGMWGAGFSQFPASLGTPRAQRVRPPLLPLVWCLRSPMPPSGEGKITQIPFFEAWREDNASRGEHPALFSQEWYKDPLPQSWGDAQGGGQGTPDPRAGTGREIPK